VSNQTSSFDESSYFFDELNKDETALHNCNSVNAYNLWPKIINNGIDIQGIDSYSDNKFGSLEEQRNEVINQTQ
jgi:hypothetical protein